MKNKSIRSQLFTLLIANVLIAILGIVLFGMGFLQESLKNQRKDDLASIIPLFSHYISRAYILEDIEGLQEYCNSISKGTNTSITFLNLNGSIICSSEEYTGVQDQRNMPEIIQFMQNRQMSSARRYSPQTGKDMLFFAAPIVDNNNNLSAILRIGITAETLDNRVAQIYSRIFIISVIILIIVSFLGMIIARHYSGMIGTIKNVVKHYAEGDFAFRISIDNPEEFNELASTMNNMADKLQHRFRTIVEQRNELEAMLAGMVEAVIMLDTHLRIKTMNPAASILFNIPISDSMGKRMLEVIRNSRFFEFAQKTLEGETLVEENIVIQGENPLYLQVHGTQLRTEEGDKNGILLVMNDITQIKRLENIRRDFVSNVSHELKTPITSIKGFVETLQTVSITDPAKLQHFLGIIENQTNRLNSIIQDLLTLSSLEHTKPDNTDLITYSVFDLLNNALNVCRPKAMKRQISVTINCETHMAVKAYPTLAEQAVVNLIDNAIKYSDEGQKVIISAMETRNFVEIHITDRGHGIPEADLPRIFERFYRVDKARSRKTGGTGLGLSIVKHIALVHGGAVYVKSKIDKGSVFTLKLPKVHNGS